MGWGGDNKHHHLLQCGRDLDAFESFRGERWDQRRLALAWFTGGGGGKGTRDERNGRRYLTINDPRAGNTN